MTKSKEVRSKKERKKHEKKLRKKSLRENTKNFFPIEKIFGQIRGKTFDVICDLSYDGSS